MVRFRVTLKFTIHQGQKQPFNFSASEFMSMCGSVPTTGMVNFGVSQYHTCHSIFKFVVGRLLYTVVLLKNSDQIQGQGQGKIQGQSFQRFQGQSQVLGIGLGFRVRVRVFYFNNLSLSLINGEFQGYPKSHHSHQTKQPASCLHLENTRSVPYAGLQRASQKKKNI